LSFSPILTRVMVYDPNPLLATSIRSGLELAGPFTAQACSSDLLENLTRFRPNILMLDPAHLPSTLETWLAEVRGRLPKCEVLAYIDGDNREAAARCLRAGFVGVVSQRQGIEALVEAVTVARLGGIYVDEGFAPTLSPVVEPEPATRGRSADGLSERERYVLEHVARGFSNKEIASRIGLSAKTVETYRMRAADKLGLRRRSDVVQYALRSGWLAEGAPAM
jgi:DNA-binding NarL/FixJ family response regulator